MSSREATHTPTKRADVELTPAPDRQFELPVFRSDHPLRKQLVRIGAAVLAVLFVAWAVAVASGILGFGALPGLSALPGVNENEPGSSGGSEASKPAATPPNRSTPAPGTGSRNQTSSVGELPGGPPGRGQSPGSPEPDAKSPAGATSPPASVPTTPTLPSAASPARPAVPQRPTSPPGQSDQTSPPGQSDQTSPPGQSGQKSPPGQSDL